MDELEREAVGIVRQYRFALFAVPAVKGLLVKIADRLGWENLRKEL